MPQAGALPVPPSAPSVPEGDLNTTASLEDESVPQKGARGRRRVHSRPRQRSCVSLPPSLSVPPPARPAPSFGTMHRFAPSHGVPTHLAAAPASHRTTRPLCDTPKPKPRRRAHSRRRRSASTASSSSASSKHSHRRAQTPTRTHSQTRPRAGTPGRRATSPPPPDRLLLLVRQLEARVQAQQIVIDKLKTRVRACVCKPGYGERAACV